MIPDSQLAQTHICRYGMKICVLRSSMHLMPSLASPLAAPADLLASCGDANGIVKALSFSSSWRSFPGST